MKNLGSYHCRDVHEWENGGQCSFHTLRLCTCEKCGGGEVLCEGKPYHTKVPLVSITLNLRWSATNVQIWPRMNAESHTAKPLPPGRSVKRGRV